MKDEKKITQKKFKLNLHYARTIYFFLACTLMSCGIKSQSEQTNYLSGDYYATVYTADSLFIEKKYDASYQLLHTLFQNKKPVHLPVYYEYKTYVKAAYLTDNKNVAYKGLRNLIKDYGLNRREMDTGEVLSKIAEESGMDGDTFSKLKQEYESKINFVLRNEILEMKKTDQAYRKRGSYFGENKRKQDSIDAVLILKSLSGYLKPPAFQMIKKWGKILLIRENSLISELCYCIPKTLSELTISFLKS